MVKNPEVLQKVLRVIVPLVFSGHFNHLISHPILCLLSFPPVLTCILHCVFLRQKYSGIMVYWASPRIISGNG